jgi:hypothetical protein
LAHPNIGTLTCSGSTRNASRSSRDGYRPPVAVPDGIDAGRAAGYLLVGPILEAVEWPGRQPLHSTPPWLDANRLAHERIHEQTRQGSTGRDKETAKLLLRHTTVDPRLREEKALQRLRA